MNKRFSPRAVSADEAMKSVLGIDAAWTEKNASGVAVAVEEVGGWKLAGTWPSVAHFQADAHGRPLPDKPLGGVARDCQDFRVWAGIMGKKESHYVPTQRT
jgi:hypothetical protein